MTASLTKMPVVQQLFETANKILGYNLLELCLNGSKAELDRTVHCQPAVFVASLAALEKYKEMKGKGYNQLDHVFEGGGASPATSYPGSSLTLLPRSVRAKSLGTRLPLQLFANQ
jgi:hypothetical protein